MTKTIKTIPKLPKRPREAHKRNFGKVLVIAGSRGMTGAAYLCCKGALRAGAGLVLLGTPQSQQPIMAFKLTCSMTTPLSETETGTLSVNARQGIFRLARNCDVIALGPGLSLHPQTINLVHSLIPFINHPMVIDADGLNALSRNIEILKTIKAPLILTPHPGEMARLSGSKTQEIKSSKVKVASEFAKKYKVVIALKGYETVVTDGTRVYVNKTGNPGMATGGSGDILAGMIAALLGQGLKPFEATQLGVYLHGLAGDLAVKEKGEVSLIATDILEYLPKAFIKSR